MCEPSGESSTQGKYDTGLVAHGPGMACAQRGRESGICLRNVRDRHAASVAGGYGRDNEAEELAFRYLSTWYRPPINLCCDR